jgi:tetratricopeptide (TPR) repeat protein
MLSLFEKLRTEIEDFIGQRDFSVLVLAAGGEQVAYAIKSIQGIEDAGSADIFLPFAHDFDRPDKFASLVVERVRASYEAARAELGLAGEGGGAPAFPVLCLDERQPAWLRIREALTFARSIIPYDGRRLVCALLPLKIRNPYSYRLLVQQLVKNDGMPPWYRGIRIIVREDTDVPLLPRNVHEAPFVKSLRVDLSSEAMASSLGEEMDNPGAPRESRAQAMLQLAAIDYAHCRYTEAISKYNELLAYYQETKNLTMQALVINGIGDVYRRARRLPAAKDWYERALVPAAASASAVVLFTVARNLAHALFELEQYPEAELFFDGAQQLGPQTRDPEARILSLEWRGLSQLKQGKFEPAAGSFEEAARLARESKRDEHCQRNAEHLRPLLAQLGRADRFEQIERELGTGRKGGVAHVEPGA